jgi:hypothetical protein
MSCNFNRFSTNRVLGHSTYVPILIVLTRHVSACDVQTSHGNAATSVDLINEKILMILLTFVTFIVGRWEKEQWSVLIKVYRFHNVVSTTDIYLPNTQTLGTKLCLNSEDSD